MNKKIKYILIAAAAVIIIAAIIFALTRPLLVETLKVKPDYVEIHFTEQGTMTGTDNYIITSPVTGKVQEVFVNEGDYVEQGGTIATIDPKDVNAEIQAHKSAIEGYRAQKQGAIDENNQMKQSYSYQLEGLKAQLSGGSLPQENVDVLKIAVDQAQIEKNYHQKVYETSKPLYEQGAITQTELNTLAQNVRRAEKQLATAQKQKELGSKEYGTASQQLNAQIKELQNNINSDTISSSLKYYDSLIQGEEATINSLSKNKNDYTIKASKTGYISSLPIKDLSYVYNQMELCAIKTSESGEEVQAKIESFVSAEDVVSLKEGTSVNIVQKTRDNEYEYKGTVKSIESWAEEEVSPLGITESKVKVIVIPSEDTPTIGSGYNVDLEYITFEAEDCIAVPNSAIFEQDEKDYVFIITKGRAKPVEIEKGPASNYETVVTKGLNKDDIVIKIASADDLKPNARVKTDTKKEQEKAEFKKQETQQKENKQQPKNNSNSATSK